MLQNVAPICGGDAQVLAEVDGPAGANQDQQLSDTAVLACTSLWSHIWTYTDVWCPQSSHCLGMCAGSTSD